MSIENYLLDLSQEITEKDLPSFTNIVEHADWRKEKTDEFVKMLGIESLLKQRRPALNLQYTDDLQNKEYVIEKLYFESLPNLFVTANLYTPHAKQQKLPAILLLCGHAQHQKHRYQEHARSLCRAGFVVLVVDTIQLGEVKGFHAGTYRHGYYHWISKGYTPAVVETWNAIRAIDLLEDLPQVDVEKIGVTGNSGGGAITWWVSCVDRRIKASASSCGTGTIHSHIAHKTINGHCDCMFPNNSYGWSLLELYALVAPNPMLILSPENDKHFEFQSVAYVYKRLEEFYDNLHVKDKVSFFNFPGAHGYSPESRKTVTQFFLKYLNAEEKSLEDIHDFDGHKESVEDLAVYQGKMPANDRSMTVQDWFIPDPERPAIEDAKSLNDFKANVKQLLMKESFAYFKELKQENIKTETNIIQDSLGSSQYSIKKFNYLTEKDFQLTGTIEGDLKAFEEKGYLAINLRDVDMKKEDISLIEHLGEKWMKTCLNVRGTGITSWGAEIDTYVRRALALCGRSIASLRVWDTLQGIKALRETFENPQRIVIAGKGEMALVALIVAFLDDHISGVILEDPPISLGGTSYKVDDKPAIEINHLARYLDLSTLTALLWPIPLVFYRKTPGTFQYTEEIYKKLGHPGGIWHLKDITRLASINFG